MVGCTVERRDFRQHRDHPPPVVGEQRQGVPAGPQGHEGWEEHQAFQLRQRAQLFPGVLGSGVGVRGSGVGVN